MDQPMFVSIVESREGLQDEKTSFIERETTPRLLREQLTDRASLTVFQREEEETSSTACLVEANHMGMV
jgi:hypothetical protein